MLLAGGREGRADVPHLKVHPHAESERVSVGVIELGAWSVCPLDSAEQTGSAVLARHLAAWPDKRERPSIGPL